MSRPLPGFVLLHSLYQQSGVEVWCGRRDGDGRPVAVKRAIEPGDPEIARRLRREGEAAGVVDHPGLLVPLGVVDDAPGVAIVYPYLAGGSVRGLLDALGALTPGEVAALLDPVASALAARHAAGGGAHGDLKPDNVLLREDGSPVVADAGSAGRATPAYLDPAASVDDPPTSTRDVFALGVLAYEALTGRRPHRGEPAEVVALAAAGAHRDLAGWPGIPAAVAAVVDSALDPDPSGRPPTPVAFAAALRAVVDPVTVVLPGPAPDARPAPTRPGVATLDLGTRPRSTDPSAVDRSGPWWVVGAAAALLVVGVSVLGPAVPSGTPRAGATGATGRTGCPPVEAGTGPGVVAVDLDADGCDDLATWDGVVLAAPADAAGDRPVRLRVGGAGLQIRFGDWDGDGATTVAAYDPDAGLVRYLDRLDRPDVERVERARRGGRARVARSDGGDRVEVLPG